VIADLKGRVALVTGSSSGIGAAVATTFGELGASVVINSVSSVDAGRRLADSLHDATYIQSDGFAGRARRTTSPPHVWVSSTPAMQRDRCSWSTAGSRRAECRSRWRERRRHQLEAQRRFHVPYRDRSVHISCTSNPLM
jgi:NAD(P)-dependent dehydrogenase (short-subunit alcohol dehydrogenase family)